MSSKLNILVAYPYMKADVISFLHENSEDIQFLLDSGAFTAWKAGKTIAVDDYCSFIEKLPFKPWRYFALDVIGDAEKTSRNYEIMLQRGLTPIPVFTRGENPQVLEEYYKTSDMVGIGGLVGTPGSPGFIKGIMERVGQRKVHWLGFNKREFIAHYRPYSCDSSSWSSAVRYASCKLYDRAGKWKQVGKQDFAAKPSSDVLRIISEYGMDPRDLAQASQWKNSGRGLYALEILTCRSWVKYQLDIAKQLGVNFHLACASGPQVKLMLDSYQYWKGKP